MKFGLLVVLAVVVLVPSLSEGRTVSKCELKEKLGAAITLPRSLQKYKEKILAMVICGVNMNSHLNTGLVRVYGRRITTTTAVPTTVVTTLSTPRVDGTTTEATTTAALTNATTTNATTTAALTNATTTTVSTTTQATTAESTTASPNATTSILPSNQTALRRKREAHKSNEESDMAEMKRLVVLLNKEVKFDEKDLQQDDKRMADEDEESDDGDEQELEEDDRPWSLGYYGLFQLSDSHFCNSGYRWSRNKCGTTCTAFTDDDIMDDIDCFVTTGYWLSVLRNATRSCYRTQNFFDKCE